jgi:hypothetical protein
MTSDSKIFNSISTNSNDGVDSITFGDKWQMQGQRAW